MLADSDCEASSREVMEGLGCHSNKHNEIDMLDAYSNSNIETEVAN